MAVAAAELRGHQEACAVSKSRLSLSIQTAGWEEGRTDGRTGGLEVIDLCTSVVFFVTLTPRAADLAGAQHGRALRVIDEIGGPARLVRHAAALAAPRPCCAGLGV